MYRMKRDDEGFPFLEVDVDREVDRSRKAKVEFKHFKGGICSFNKIIHILNE